MDTVMGILLAAVALITVITLIRAVRIVPQQREDVVERLGKYKRTLQPGLNLLVPFIDAVRTKVDMREQVVSFPPQPVITSDNLGVSIDTVLYFKVADSVKATYEISNFLQAIEQLTVTTLRNVIGSLDLERALTSREEINRHLSGVLDETTGRWGIKVTRVEIKAIEPPPSIRDSMEKQMRAERDRRAAILNAEGQKQSQILTAEGRSRPRCFGPTVTGRPGSSRRRGRPRRSAPSSTRSTRPTRARRCWPTSTSRRCRRSPTEPPTRSGSCPPS
ncbi:hypothetical protein GCM10027615_69030 [Plantactinospora veratri]